MSETTPKNVVFEKPKAVWVAGAWLSTVAAVLGAGMTTFMPLYGATFALLVAAWVVYGVGRPLSQFRVVALVCLAVWTIGLEAWLGILQRLVISLFNSLPDGLGFTGNDRLLSIAIAMFICGASGLLAGLATRSRPTMLVCIGASGVVWSLLTNHLGAIFAAAACWHAIVVGAIVLWAVRARTRRLSGSHCAGCGYDLAGIEGPVCPECGRARVMAAAAALKA